MGRSKSQKILRYGLFGVFGVVGLGVFGYVLVFRPLQIRAQKQNFAKAEASLDALATQIQNTVGKADETKKEKSCGYASQVFGRGSRGCAISIFLLFRSRELTKANDDLLTLSKLSNKPIYYYLGDHDYQGNPYPKNFVSYSGRGPSQQFSQDTFSYGDISCRTSYLYPVIPLFDKQFSDLSGENIELTLACSGSAMSEFYPVKK